MKTKGPIQIDQSWTLFLDRDGVINVEEQGTYVCLPDEFKFLPGVLDGLKIASTLFETIVVVTNQQGVGKGLLTEEDLGNIHHKMLREINAAGGRIDKVYHCPDLVKFEPECRKPNIGMAHSAQNDFPNIEFKKSVMVGNYITDMEFARNAGMLSVLVEEKERISEENSHLIDFYFDSLYDLISDIEILPQ